MALNWLWENKCGTLVEAGRRWNEETQKTEDAEYSYTLYDGNALMIALAEWEEDGETYWQMGDFWVDEKHMENCMEDNASRFIKIRLNTKKIAKKKLNTIIKACIKYGITIELYASEE